MAPTVTLDFEVKGDGLDRQLVQTEKGFDRIATAAKRAGDASKMSADKARDSFKEAGRMTDTFGSAMEGLALKLGGLIGIQQILSKIIELERQAADASRAFSNSLVETLARTGDLQNQPFFENLIKNAPGNLKTGPRIAALGALRENMRGASPEAVGAAFNQISAGLEVLSPADQATAAAITGRVAGAGVPADVAARVGFAATQAGNAEQFSKAFEQLVAQGANPKDAAETVAAFQMGIVESGQAAGRGAQLPTSILKGMDAYASATRSIINPTTKKAEEVLANPAFAAEYAKDPLGLYKRVISGQVDADVLAGVSGENKTALAAVIRKGGIARGQRAYQSAPSPAEMAAQSDEISRMNSAADRLDTEERIAQAMQEERGQKVLRERAVRQGFENELVRMTGNTPVISPMVAMAGGAVAHVMDTLGITISAQDGMDARSY